MNCRVIFFFALAIVALALLSTNVAASSYRKPPFNGSIFGKRGTATSADAESRIVAFSSLCEIAVEACSAWAAAAQDSK